MYNLYLQDVKLTPICDLLIPKELPLSFKSTRVMQSHCWGIVVSLDEGQHHGHSFGLTKSSISFCQHVSLHYLLKARMMRFEYEEPNLSSSHHLKVDPHSLCLYEAAIVEYSQALRHISGRHPVVWSAICRLQPCSFFSNRIAEDLQKTNRGGRQKNSIEFVDI